MKMKRKIWIISFVAFLLHWQDKAMAEENWTVIQDEDGIVVEMREIAGYATKQFRSKTIVQAPFSRILGLFQDMEHKSEWQPDTKERILEEVNDREMYTYRRVSTSVVSDRDMILHVQVKPDAKEKAVYVTFESVASTPTPEKNQKEVSGVVRMPFIRGHWKLKPMMQGQFTEVEYEMHLALGGSIPNWIVNRVLKKMPYKTMLVLQKQALIRRYPEFEKNLEQHPEYKAVLAP